MLLFLRYKKFFGLRDFIHFINYIRRKRQDDLDPQLVMKALERNFNGCDYECFHDICAPFLEKVNSNKTYFSGF